MPGGSEAHAAAAATRARAGRRGPRPRTAAATAAGDRPTASGAGDRERRRAVPAARRDAARSRSDRCRSRRTEYASGLRVVTERMPGVRSVSLGFWVDRRLPRRAAGRSAAPATSSSTCCSRARSTRTARDIAEAFDAVGGDLNAFTAKEYTCYYARVLDRDLPMAVEHLADMLQHSTIATGRPRGRAPGDPRGDRHARGLARATSCTTCSPRRCGPSHPLGRPVLGTRARRSARPRARPGPAASTAATTCPAGSSSRRPAT